MKWVSCLALGLSIVGLSAPAAFADNMVTGNALYPGCTAVLDHRDANLTQQALCVGTISAALSLLTTEWIVRKELLVCRPDGAPLNQAIRIVIKYMDDHPDMMHYDLSGIAVVALQNAWKCQK